MKKKVLIIVVVVLVVVGGIVAGLVLTGGGVTEEDNQQGEETDEAIEEVLDNPEDIKMEETDPSLDSLEDAVDLGDFDPNDI